MYSRFVLGLWMGVGALAVAVMGVACSGPQRGDGLKAATLPFGGQVLHVFNWSDYIDPALIQEFESRTGARVQYDTYSSDAELETKMVTGASGYDVVFPSDRSMPMLISKGLLMKLDKELLHNRGQIDAKFRHPPFDPDAEYTIPYFWGTLAIGIRTDHVADPGEGFDALFDDRYSGRITMLDDGEHNVAVALMQLGRDMNSLAPDDLEAAKKLLLAQKPLVQAYTSDSFKERLMAGDSWVTLGWSGDLIQAKAECPEIRVIVPPSGTMLWIDSMAIPKDAKHAKLAHAFIDFLLEPAIAARNAEFVKYASPVSAARSLVAKELAEDSAVYPPQPILEKCGWLQDRGSGITKIEDVWRAVK